MYNLENNNNKSTQSFVVNYWINNKISDCSKNVRNSYTNKTVSKKSNNSKTSKKK